MRDFSFARCWVGVGRSWGRERGKEGAVLDGVAWVESLGDVTVLVFETG